MRIHHKIKQLNIEWSRNYDAKILYFMEHIYGQDDDGRVIHLKTKIMTNDGWRDVEEGVEYPFEKLPSISGQDLFNYRCMEDRLKEWQQMINSEIHPEDRDSVDEHIGD